MALKSFFAVKRIFKKMNKMLATLLTFRERRSKAMPSATVNDWFGPQLTERNI